MFDYVLPMAIIIGMVIFSWLSLLSVIFIEPI